MTTARRGQNRTKRKVLRFDDLVTHAAESESRKRLVISRVDPREELRTVPEGPVSAAWSAGAPRHPSFESDVLKINPRRAITRGSYG